MSQRTCCRDISCQGSYTTWLSYLVTAASPHRASCHGVGYQWNASYHNIPYHSYSMSWYNVSQHSVSLYSMSPYRLRTIPAMQWPTPQWGPLPDVVRRLVMWTYTSPPSTNGQNNKTFSDEYGMKQCQQQQQKYECIKKKKNWLKLFHMRVTRGKGVLPLIIGNYKLPKFIKVNHKLHIFTYCIHEGGYY